MIDLKPINWGEIGLSDSGGDSCLWIGTEGSQTRLHHDSYGWNCICQLYGRKLWRLWPKNGTTDKTILPTRVPFEESTIWGVETADSIKNEEYTEICLKPGEMLVIPPRWWHHVYSLDFSISVNIWSPNEATDPAQQEKEAMTRIMAKICADSGHVNVPTLDQNFGDVEQLINFLPKANKHVIQERDRLFHAFTKPNVIDAIIQAYRDT